MLMEATKAAGATHNVSVQAAAEQFKNDAQQRISLGSTHKDKLDFLTEAMTSPKYENVPEMLREQIISAQIQMIQRMTSMLSDLIKQLHEISMKILSNFR